MSYSKLSTHLGYWRAERPSEWKMDEFIQQAEALEAELMHYRRVAEACHDCGTRERAVYMTGDYRRCFKCENKAKS